MLIIKGLGDLKILLSNQLNDKEVWKGKKSSAGELTKKWKKFLGKKPLSLAEAEIEDTEKWLLKGSATVDPDSAGVFKLLIWAEETVTATSENQEKLSKKERRQFKIALYLKMLAIAYLAEKNIENTAEGKQAFVNKHILFVAQMKKIANRNKGKEIKGVIATFEAVLQELSPGFSDAVIGVEHQLELAHTPFHFELHDLSRLNEIKRADGSPSRLNKLIKFQQTLLLLLTEIDTLNLQLRTTMPNYFGHLTRPFSHVENNESLFDFFQEIQQLLFNFDQLGRLYLTYRDTPSIEERNVLHGQLIEIILTLIPLQFNFVISGLYSYTNFRETLGADSAKLITDHLWESAFDLALNEKQAKLNDFRIINVIRPLSDVLKNSSLIELLKKMICKLLVEEMRVPMWVAIIKCLVVSYRETFLFKLENLRHLPPEDDRGTANEQISLEASKVLKEIENLKTYLGITDPVVSLETLLTAPAAAAEPVAVPTISVTDAASSDDEGEDDAAATVDQGLDALLKSAGELSVALQSLTQSSATTTTATAGPAAADSVLNPAAVLSTMFARSGSGSGSAPAPEDIPDERTIAAATLGSSSASS